MGPTLDLELRVIEYKGIDPFVTTPAFITHIIRLKIFPPA